MAKKGNARGGGGGSSHDRAVRRAAEKHFPAATMDETFQQMKKKPQAPLQVIEESTITQKIWGWPVVGSVVLFLLAGGLGFMAGHFPYWADLFLILGAVIFVVKMILWKDIRQQKSGIFLPITMSCLLVVIVALLIWSNHQISPSVPYVTFKDAHEFTWWRRQVIIHDVSNMRDYFTSVGVRTPDTLPPFTVSDERSGTFTPPLEYQGELIVPRSLVTDRQQVTLFFTAFVIQKAIPDTGDAFDFSNPNIAIHIWQRDFFSSVLRDYFQASYWGRFASQEPHTAILWKIRSALGQRLTDKLVSYVLRIVGDSKGETIDPDMNASFAKVLKDADRLVEADQQSWPKIQDILDHNKVKIGFEDKTTRPSLQSHDAPSGAPPNYSQRIKKLLKEVKAAQAEVSDNRSISFEVSTDRKGFQGLTTYTPDGGRIVISVPASSSPDYDAALKAHELFHVILNSRGFAGVGPSPAPNAEILFPENLRQAARQSMLPRLSIVLNSCFPDELIDRETTKRGFNPNLLLDKLQESVQQSSTPQQNMGETWPEVVKKGQALLNFCLANRLSSSSRLKFEAETVSQMGPSIDLYTKRLIRKFQGKRCEITEPHDCYPLTLQLREAAGLKDVIRLPNPNTHELE